MKMFTASCLNNIFSALTALIYETQGAFLWVKVLCKKNEPSGNKSATAFVNCS